MGGLYYERLENLEGQIGNLEGKVDKVLNVLDPQKIEEKDEVVEKLHNLIDDFDDLQHTVNQIDVSLNRIEPIIQKIETNPIEINLKDEDLKKFNQNRIAWFSGSALILLGITYIFYSYNSIFFLIAAGFFVANLGILMQLFYDWKLTPGDSYAKISKHPIALAITLLVIAFYTYMGISVGEKYIPDSFRGEASQRIEERLNNIERIISDQKDKKQVPETSEDDDSNGGESNRIPNR